MKLTDTQQQILTAAAAHPDGLALPPDRLPAAPRQAVGKALLKAGLVATAANLKAEPGTAWTIDGQPTLLRITDVGLAAVGVETAQEAPQMGAEAARAPEGDAAETAPEGFQEPASGVPGPSGRLSLRDAATAVVAAWNAPGDRTGMKEAIAALRAALAGKAPRQPRQPGVPRKPREGTKQQQVLALLRRPEGATIAQVAEAMGWQQHTVRGFFAGLKTRQGIAVEVLERVRQVGAGKDGAKGSYSVYRIADAG
ncbi:DUF3489 domain-containing protein [Falsiroseomonas sp. HW251]|uniref:DUF3489 domain-containing protein n=1 Tax=Falsiroseomonas sp. HW251 TaxID=3390998 RepID=UPI003D322066